MHGIYIPLPLVGVVLEPTANANRLPVFEYIFRPILDCLADHYWYADRYQAIPLEWLDIGGGLDRLETLFFTDIPNAPEWFREGSGSGCIFCPSILPELATAVRNDSTDLIGFRAPSPDAAGAIAREFLCNSEPGMPSLYELAEKHAQFCFFCEDGASWEIYTPNSEVLRIVYEWMQGKTEREVETRSLRDKLQELLQ